MLHCICTPFCFRFISQFARYLGRFTATAALYHAWEQCSALHIKASDVRASTVSLRGCVSCAYGCIFVRIIAAPLPFQIVVLSVLKGGSQALKRVEAIAPRCVALARILVVSWFALRMCQKAYPKCSG